MLLLLVLVVLLLLLHLVVVSNGYSGVPAVTAHTDPLGGWLAGVSTHSRSCIPFSLLLLVVPLSLLTLLFIVVIVIGEKLSLRIRDRVVSKNIRGGGRILFKVVIRHGSLAGDALHGVHYQQLGQ